MGQPRRRHAMVLRTVFKVLLSLAGVLPFQMGTCQAQIGTLDATYEAAANGAVNACVTQDDGKIVIVGDFTSFRGQPCQRIARLNSDGSIDLAFASHTSGIDAGVQCVELQPNGKILIGGDFLSVSGVPRIRIARLNSDGSLDSSFDPGLGANGRVRAIAVNSMVGGIVIGGEFLSFNGIPRNRVAQLQDNGTLDRFRFSGAGADGTVYAVRIVSMFDNQGLGAFDEGIYIGGDFRTMDGQARSCLAKYNISGFGLDPLFNANSGTAPNAAVRVIAYAWGLCIGGDFTAFGATPRTHLAFVSTMTGSPTDSVNQSIDGPVLTISKGPSTSNGGMDTTKYRLDIGGGFTHVAGGVHLGMARLEAIGSMSSSPHDFQADHGFTPSFNGPVFCIAYETDGKIFAGGSFTSAGQNPGAYFARLYDEGGIGPPGVPTVSLVGPGSDSRLAVIWSGVPYATGYSIERSMNGVDDWSEVGGTSTGSVDFPFIDTSLVAGQTYYYRIHAYNTNGEGMVSAIKGGTTLSSPWEFSGSGDSGFAEAAGFGANSSVECIAMQKDGKILLGGFFVSLDPTAKWCHLVRLNEDGSRDSTFRSEAGPDSTVNALAIQEDGKILIGGGFRSVGGIARNCIARMNVDGALDTSFAPVSGTDFGVDSIAVQTDGKILIAGGFSEADGATHNGIARLNPNGEVDATFNASLLFSDGWCLGIQPDGKIVVGGFFQSANGTRRGNIARFNVDGSLDTSFANLAGADGWIEDLMIQPDGKIVIAGAFSNYNGSQRRGIARLLSDGSLDTTFSPGSALENAWPFCTAVQEDGKVLVGGWFTVVSGAVRLRIARFNADGALDTSFQPGLGADGNVNVIAVQRDGKALVGGSFRNMAGQASNGIARLNADNGAEAPMMPSLLSSSPSSSTSVFLTWSTVSFVSGYRVQRSSDGLTEWADVAFLAAPAQSYLVTNLIPGSRNFFRIQAVSTNGGSLFSHIGQIDTYTRYQQWKLDHSLSLNASDDLSPAGDGIPILLKYALGLEPWARENARLPSPGTIDNDNGQHFLSLTFQQMLPATDVRYVPEVSDDLRTWSSAQTDVISCGDSINPDGVSKTVIVRDATPIGGTSKRFIRLRVTRP